MYNEYSFCIMALAVHDFISNSTLYSFSDLATCLMFCVIIVVLVAVLQNHIKAWCSCSSNAMNKQTVEVINFGCCNQT